MDWEAIGIGWEYPEVDWAEIGNEVGGDVGDISVDDVCLAKGFVDLG